VVGAARRLNRRKGLTAMGCSAMRLGFLNRKDQKYWWVAGFVCLVWGNLGQAVTHGDQRYAFKRTFATDSFVKKQVRFWEAIFQKYESNSVVIHDLDEPLAMVDVINFDQYVLPDGNMTSIDSSDQTELVKKYIERYDIGVERFKKFGEKALEFGAIEQRLFDVYKREPELLEKLYRGDVKFRGQAGLANTFFNAAQRAQEYLPYMEDVFRRENVPIHLTRLPFVESMFNLAARSKVGASGIWQFMPETAREYMMVNRVVDERNNPYKATHAAARLLEANYRELGSWPLAVTAYNHGRAGMQKASRELGTTQLGDIIRKYRSGSFGFASKNFYSEFVAAVNSYDYLIKTGKLKPKKQMDRSIDTLALTKPMSVRDIVGKTNVTIAELASLNPCINSSTLSERSEATLPIRYVLRLNKAAAKQLKKQRVAVAAQAPIALASGNARNSRR
jgi:membrane-bound lytic murein transglycosylase D